MITGCSSGIGLATAVAFAQGGDTVIATMRDTERAGRLNEALHPVVAAHGIHWSLVEPGPVVSEFRERMGGVDGRNATGPYAEQWKSFLPITDAGYDAAESPEAVAEVVLRIADEPPPPLRYQTTEATARLIAYKVADLDGSRVTKITRRWPG